MKGRGNSHPSSEKISAVMAQDMVEWANQNTGEQKAQEEIEHIQLGVSSSSQPPVTRMNTGPNEVATKRQRMAEPQMGATSFKELFADTTGHRLDDLIVQNVTGDPCGVDFGRTNPI
jgi:hypothetical protein